VTAEMRVQSLDILRERLKSFHAAGMTWREIACEFATRAVPIDEHGNVVYDGGLYRSTQLCAECEAAALEAAQ